MKMNKSLLLAVIAVGSIATFIPAKGMNQQKQVIVKKTNIFMQALDAKQNGTLGEFFKKAGISAAAGFTTGAVIQTTSTLLPKVIGSLITTAAKELHGVADLYASEAINSNSLTRGVAGVCVGILKKIAESENSDWFTSVWSKLQVPISFLITAATLETCKEKCRELMGEENYDEGCFSTGMISGATTVAFKQTFDSINFSKEELEKIYKQRKNATEKPTGN